MPYRVYKRSDSDGVSRKRYLENLARTGRGRKRLWSYCKSDAIVREDKHEADLLAQCYNGAVEYFVDQERAK